MKIDDARRLRDDLKREHARDLSDLAERQSAADAKLQTIQGLEAMFPELRESIVDAGTSPDPEKPRDRVLAVLKENPGKKLTVAEIVDRLRQHGWIDASAKTPPAHPTRRHLRDLLAEGVIKDGKKDDRTKTYEYVPSS